MYIYKYVYICVYICINMYDDIMDTGRYSELGGSILYVVRLAVRVEGYLKFLVRYLLYCTYAYTYRHYTVHVFYINCMY